MNVRNDDWQAFLEQRDDGAGWQWPLNLAVALHLAIFASAAALQNWAGSGPGFRLDNTVTVNFVNLANLGQPLATAPKAEVTLKSSEAPLPAPVKITPQKLKKKAEKTVEPRKAKPQQPLAKEEQTVAKEVEQPVAKEVVVVEPKPEPPVPVVEKLAQPVMKKVVENKPDQEVKKPIEKTPEPKAAEAVPPKPEATPASMLQAKKDVVSLNPIKKTAQEKNVAEQAKIAEAKKQEELARLAAAKIEAEKKAAVDEAKRVAEEKAQKEKAAKIAEAKRGRERIAAEAKRIAKVEAEKKAAAAEARRKIAAMEQRKALAEAQRIEHDAQAARQAAATAREQLVRALRQNVAVSSAVSETKNGGNGSLLGGGIGTGGSVGVGGTMALKQYASALNEKISSSWKVPEMVNANRKLKTVVALIVSKTGTIEELKIEQKSGDALFDQSVLKALRNAAPLPNFPALIREPKLEFALNFTPQGLTL